MRIECQISKFLLVDLPTPTSDAVFSLCRVDLSCRPDFDFFYAGNRTSTQLAYGFSAAHDLARSKFWGRLVPKFFLALL